MLAAVYHGIGNIQVESVCDPIADERTIIIQVDCCLICGTDQKIYRHGRTNVAPPRILGHEFSGRIVHMGAPVPGFEVGSRVTVAATLYCGKCPLCRQGLGNMCENLAGLGTALDGAFAQYVALPVWAAGHMVKVGETVSSAAAALCEPLACAINAQELIGVGEHTVVIGGGPLGALHALLAHIWGSRVTLIETSADRLRLLEGLQGVKLIDSSKHDPREEILDKTHGLGADRVIVCAPSASAFALSLKLAGKGGRISFFASLPFGEQALELDSHLIHYNELGIFGASNSRIEHVQQAAKLVEAGGFDCIVTHELKLPDIAQGFALMEEKASLKVAIYP